MPSLTEIGTNIQNTLNQVESNTSNTNTAVHTLISVDQTGFISLSNGLAAIIDQQVTANTLLDYERQQNDTIICWLQNIADVLCRSLRVHEQQLKVQTSIDESIREVKDILEIVNGSAAVEVLRRRELQRQIEACCPPHTPEPLPCFRPCTEPPFKPYTPQVPPYRPLPSPQK